MSDDNDVQYILPNDVWYIMLSKLAPHEALDTYQMVFGHDAPREFLRYATSINPNAWYEHAVQSPHRILNNFYDYACAKVTQANALLPNIDIPTYLQWLRKLSLQTLCANECSVSTEVREQLSSLYAPVVILHTDKYMLKGDLIKCYAIPTLPFWDGTKSIISYVELNATGSTCRPHLLCCVGIPPNELITSELKIVSIRIRNANDVPRFLRLVSMVSPNCVVRVIADRINVHQLALYVQHGNVRVITNIPFATPHEHIHTGCIVYNDNNDVYYDYRDHARLKQLSGFDNIFGRQLFGR